MSLDWRRWRGDWLHCVGNAVDQNGISASSMSVPSAAGIIVLRCSRNTC